MVGGVVLCGVASGLYIGAQLGRGPRDGLMTGLARRTGLSIRLVRTLLEIAVVLVGLTLGGVLGVGTVVYALTIGPLTQLFLPWCLVTRRPRPRWRTRDDGSSARLARPAAEAPRSRFLPPDFSPPATSGRGLDTRNWARGQTGESLGVKVLVFPGVRRGATG